MLKSIILLTFFITSLNVHAQYFGLSILPDFRKVSGHDEYDIASCNQYDKEDDSYFVLCDQNNEIQTASSLDSLAGAMAVIEENSLEDEFLTKFKSSVLTQMRSKQSQLDNLIGCFGSVSYAPGCVDVVRSYVLRVQNDLPKLRALMAQMNTPGKIYSPTKPERFYRELEHKQTQTRLPSITEEETNFLREHTDTLEEAFRADVVAEVPMLNECVNRNPCNGKEIIISTYIDRKFDQQNKQYSEAYAQMLSNNPILSLLSLTGKEDFVTIKSQISSKLPKIKDHLKKSIDYVNELEGSKRDKLTAFDLSLQKFMGEEPTKVMCDISQNLIDDHGRDQILTDVLFIGGTIAAAGACAFTAGLGCAVAVAVVGEGINLLHSKSKLMVDENLFFAGEVDLATLTSSEQNYQLSLFMAPLALVGTGGAKILLRARNLPVKFVEQRFNFSQRNLVDNLKRDLGHKVAQIESYFARNKSMSESDRYFFAGIVDELEKRLKKAHPNMSQSEINSKIQKQVDEIMEKCHDR